MAVKGLSEFDSHNCKEKEKNMAKDTNQVVEVVFPSGGKTYSYIGSGNLRVGQKISNAPVNHYKTGTPYTAPVTVVATHEVVGAEVGKKIGVSGGQVHSISKPLKYLPGTRQQQQNSVIDVGGKEMTVSQYLSPFEARDRLLSYNGTKDTSTARNQLLSY